ncbi:MAG TPA: S8 family serine peptidase, partial [Candidatus Cybelea sp.]|nr:S8 family serine peptidase [Candidatus Cybelea sp.]
MLDSGVKAVAHLPEASVAAVSHIFHAEAAPVVETAAPPVNHAAPLDLGDDGLLLHAFSEVPDFASGVMHALFDSVAGTSPAPGHLDGMASDGAADFFGTPDAGLEAAFAAIKNGQFSVLDTGLATAALGSAAPGEDGFVTIDATAKDGDGAALLTELETLGLTAGSSFGAMASGFLPVAEIAALAGLADLRFAQESLAAGDVGKVTSQGDAAMLSDIARTTFGVDGTGVPVGVLSDSFNAKGGLTGNQASGDLPANTTILKDFPLGTDEGRAMAQIVHDVAPGSPILFATALAGEAGFANNIVALANAGAKVIVDDVLYFTESAYQDGPIAQAIDQVVANGAVYFSAAGNNSNHGFETAFKASASIFGGETLAQLSSSGDAGLTLTLPAGTQTNLTLQWNQPEAAVSPGHGAQSNLDLFVFDAVTRKLVTYSIDDNVASGNPFEVVQIKNTSTASHDYLVAVGLAAGPAPTAFQLLSLDNGAGAHFAPSTLNDNDGTIFGHAAAAGAIAVGAAYYGNTPDFGVNPPVVESYSSNGPTTIYFDADGNPLPTPEVRNGPAITAPDGADTTFFVPGDDSDGDGFPNFFGTSAAAPHAAAVAALMLQANAALNASDIRNLMEDSAIDMDDPTTAGFDKGFDNATGAGLLQANLAVGYAQSLTLTADASHAVLLGTHLDDTFIGGPGSHSFDGGAGKDALDYSAAAGPVSLDVSTGTASNGFGGTDTFANFEVFRGGSFGDTLKGGSGSDSLDGGAGNDTLTGG